MDIIKQLKEWLKEEHKAHEDGELMSMAEALYGRIWCTEVLDKIKELEKQNEIHN